MASPSDKNTNVSQEVNDLYEYIVNGSIIGDNDLFEKNIVPLLAANNEIVLEKFVTSGTYGSYMSEVKQYLSTISNMTIAIAAALYGNNSMKDTDQYSTIISKLGNVDLSKTPFGTNQIIDIFESEKPVGVFSGIGNLDSLKEVGDNMLTAIQDIAESVRSISYNDKDPIKMEISAGDDLKNILSGLESTKTEDKGNSQSICKSILESMTALSSFDSKKYDDIVKNVRKIRGLFEKPRFPMLTKLGVSNQGLLRSFFMELGEMLSELEPSKADAKLISETFKGIIELIKLDPKQIDKAADGVYDLIDLVSTNNPEGYFGFIQNLVEIVKYMEETNLTRRKEMMKDLNTVISRLVGSVDGYDDLSDEEQAIKSLMKFSKKLKKLIAELGSEEFDEMAMLVAAENIEFFKEYVVTPYSTVLDPLDFATVLENLIKIKFIQSTIQPTIDIVRGLSGIDLNDIQNANDRLVSLSDTSDKISKVFNGLDTSLIAIIRIGILSKQGIKSADNLVNLIPKLNEVIEALDEFDVTKEDIEKFNQIAELTQGFKKTSTSLILVGILAPLSILGVKAMLSVVKQLGEVIENLKGLVVPEDVVKNVENLQDIVNSVGSMMLIAGLVGTLMIPLIPGLLLFGVTFGLFVKKLLNTISTINDPGKAAETIKEIRNLVIGCGLILMVGALFMMIPNMFLNAMLFTVTLGIFLVGILGVINIMSRLAGEKTIADARGMGKMVFLLGITMMIGALFMMIPNMFKSAILFTVGLALFLVGTLGVLLLIAKFGGKNTIARIGQLGTMIASLGLVMVIGSLFMMIPGMFVNALLFTVAIALFIVGTIGVILLISKVAGRRTINDIKNVVKAIALLGLVMLVGAAFMYIPKMFENALKFTLLIALFVIGTVGVITIIAGIFGNKTVLSLIRTMLLSIILISAVVLFAGWMMMKNPGLGPAIKEFMFDVFILVGGMALIFTLLSLIPRKMILSGIMALGGIIVSLLVLSFVVDNMAMTALKIKDAGGFDFFDSYLIRLGIILGGAAALVITFGLIYTANAPMLIAGVLGLAGLAIDLWLIGKAMDPIIDSFLRLQPYPMDQFDSYLLRVGIILLAATGVVIGLGALMTSGIGALLFVAGVAALAGLAGAVFLVGKAMEAVANGMDSMKKVEDFKPDKILEALKNVALIADAMAPIGDPKYSTKMMAASRNVMYMAAAMSKIAKTVQEYASLTIPEYEGTKVVSYRNLTETDFNDAAKNIKTIISTIGGALIDLYNEKPEMFQSQGLFGLGGTIFDKVVKGVGGLGGVIEKIAHGVQSYAELKIPIYGQRGGKLEIVGYKQLGAQDFQDAADNITTVISVMIGAFADMWSNGIQLKNGPRVFVQELFEGETIITSSPIGRIINASKAIGDVLTSISEGLLSYIDLKIPEYGMVNGKLGIVGYKPLPKGFFNDAANNIADVVTTIIKAFAGIYYMTIKTSGGNIDGKALFSGTGAFGLGDTPITKVVVAAKNISEIISTIAESLCNYAQLQIPEYGMVNGKLEIVNYKKLTGEDITQAAQNIADVVKVLFEGFAGAHDSLKKKEKDIKKVTKAIEPVSTTVSNLVDTITKILSGKYPTGYDKNGKATGYASLADGDTTKISKKIISLVTVIPTALNTAIRKNSGLFIGDTFEKIQKVMQEGSELVIFSMDQLKKMQSESEGFAFMGTKVEGANIEQIEKNITEIAQIIPHAIWTAITDDGQIKLEYSPLFLTTLTLASINYKYLSDKFLPTLFELYSTANVKEVSRIITLAPLLNKAVQLSTENGGLAKIILDGKMPTFGIVDGIKIVTTLKAIKSVLIPLIDIYKYMGKNEQFLKNVFINSVRIKSIFSAIGQLEFDNLKKIPKNLEKFATSYAEGISPLIDLYNYMGNNEVALSKTDENTERLKYIFDAIEEINFDALIKAPISEFGTFSYIYKDGMLNILYPYMFFIPTKEQTDDMVYAVSSISDAVSTVKDPSNFEKEAYSTRLFVNSINRVDLAKTNAMTKLLDSMRQTLDQSNNNRLQQLMSSLITIIDILAKQLMDTSNTMQQATEIQKKRQEVIEKTIKEMHKMIDQPINVVVTENGDNGTKSGGSKSGGGGGGSTSSGGKGGSSGDNQILSMIRDLQQSFNMSNDSDTKS